MLNIAICDDLPFECQHIKKWLGQYAIEYGLHINSHEFYSGEELIRNYNKQYDLIILDIEMIGINGIETAKKIREIDEEILILFATHHKDYAVDSYKVDACGYLMKSGTYEEFCTTLKRVFKKLKSKQKDFAISVNGKLHYYQIGTILYVEYYEHKLSFYFINGDVLEVKGSIKSLLDQNPNELLMQIHKNCIVNKLWIESCKQKVIRIKGIEKDFEVSRPKWKMVERAYLQFCLEKML